MAEDVVIELAESPDGVVQTAGAPLGVSEPAGPAGPAGPVAPAGPAGPGGPGGPGTPLAQNNA